MKNLIFLALCLCAFMCPSWMSASSTEFNNTPSELAEDDAMNCSFVIRARLAAGSSGGMELKIDDVTVKSWTLSSSSYQNFTYTGACGSNVKVEFLDYGSDLAINYIEVNGTRYEAESQAVNTGVWQGQCGGSYNERLDCSGYIDFGDVSGGNGGGGGGGGSSTNVAAGKSVTATAQQSGNGAGKLTDGDSSDNSRWSAKNFPQSATIDLGASFSIDEVKVHTYQGRAYRYRIQASCDNSNWTTVVDRSSNSTGGNPITDNFSAVDARYVRIRVTGASGYSGSWISINELEVFGSSSTGCSSSGGGGGGGGGSSSDNVAKNKSVSATAQQSGNGASKLTNGNRSDNSRWAAENFPQSATIDLGASFSIDEVKLYTYKKRAYRYTIQTSCDNSNWTTVVNRSNNTKKGNPITDSFSAVDARYVRIRVTGASGYSGSWISINELEVYGTPSNGCSGGGGGGGSCNGAGNPDIFAQNDLLKYGVNMSTMEGYPTEGSWSNGIILCENDFKRAADVGITSFRIPIRWENKLGSAPNYKVDANWFARIDEVIGWAMKHGESVIINVHHFDELTTNPNATNRAKFNAIWRQVSERYQCESNKLFFELLNEPKDAFNNDIKALNSLHADALAIIRQTNPHRSVIIGGRYAGSLGGLWDPEFETFPNDDDIILELHYYNPLEFTHQGAWWCCGFPTGNPWPNANTGEYNVDYELGMAADFVANNSGKPIHLGEFGALGRDIDCNVASPPASRARYVDFVIKTCVKYGMSWSHWEWKGHYGIYNEFTNNLLADMAESIAQDQFKASGVNKSTLTKCNGNNPPANYCSGAGNSIVGTDETVARSSVKEGANSGLTSHPSPFTESTMIQFNLAGRSSVSLSVVDLQGKTVRSIYDGAMLDKGLNQVELKAKGLSAGMYFIHLQIGDEVQVHKLILE